MDFYSSLVSGVIGGVIATLIVVMFREFFTKVIVQWYEERVYVGPHIEGRWKSVYVVDGVTREGIWEIRRVGHAVTAHVTRITGPKAGSTWKFVGTFNGLILTTTYISTDKRLMDRGTVTLKTTKDASNFKGWLSFYSSDKDTICSVQYKLERISDDAVSKSGDTTLPIS